MKNLLRKILTLTMSGLVTVLPLALTVYVIWWLVHTVEGWLRRALIALGIVSPEHYWPGLGLMAGFILLLIVGSLVNAYAGKIFLKYWDDFLGRIPFVKTLYGGFRDVVSLLPSGSGEKRDLQRVVLARFADVHAIGFVTREDAPAVLDAHGGQDWVTVYFPMSYAFGGYTIYLPRELIQPLDISVEDAMRLAITAGLTAGEAVTDEGASTVRLPWLKRCLPAIALDGGSIRIGDRCLLPAPLQPPAALEPVFRLAVCRRAGAEHPQGRQFAGGRSRIELPRTGTIQRLTPLPPGPRPSTWPPRRATSLPTTRASAGCACSCVRGRRVATFAIPRPPCAGWTPITAPPGWQRSPSPKETRTRRRSPGSCRTWLRGRGSISIGTARWCCCSML